MGVSRIFKSFVLLVRLSVCVEAAKPKEVWKMKKKTGEPEGDSAA